MSAYVTVRLFNPAANREQEIDHWFSSDHASDLTRLDGFVGADLFEIAPEQIMSDIAQPWRFMSLYEFDYEVPDRDIPKLGKLFNDARISGLFDDSLENERIHTYNMYSDWYRSANWQRDKPLSGVSVLFGNFIAGREDEYHRWYDDVHAPEVSNVPGHVGLRRGRLAGTQCEPRRYCPGSELVLCAQQTDNLGFTIADFGARAVGVSPSGIAMQPRSTAGSFARTVHYFVKRSGEKWPGGIAYAGDLSVYEAGR